MFVKDQIETSQAYESATLLSTCLDQHTVQVGRHNQPLQATTCFKMTEYEREERDSIFDKMSVTLLCYRVKLRSFNN